MYKENSFRENAYTVEGSLEHSVVDEPGSLKNLNYRFEDALPLYSDTLGLSGKADRVEFYDDVPYPLEFKLGRGTNFSNNLAQLCAQALCLEEMLNIKVPEGAIFHISSHRREIVSFDQSLRNSTHEIISKVRELLNIDQIPKGILEKKCQGCSLH